MPKQYASTAFQHSGDIQKEFERAATFINELNERLEALEKPEEAKKQEIYSLTIKHNNRVITKAKEVQVLNFLDSDNINYDISRKSNSNKSEVSKDNATEIIIQPTANVDNCINDLLGLYQLLMARRGQTITNNLISPYRAIKCDNPGDILGNKASDKLAVGGAIQSANFQAYPILPLLANLGNSTTYNLHPYRGLKYYNECFNQGMTTIDNTPGYTQIHISEPGLYKVSCVFTGQYDNIDSTEDMEVHGYANPASADGETVVELMLMKNGAFNSLLNAMRVANKSVHLQGEDLLYLTNGDVISIGFKAYEQIWTTRSEINLVWGSPDSYIPLYSHLTVERISDSVQSYSNAGHTYSEEY